MRRSMLSGETTLPNDLVAAVALSSMSSGPYLVPGWLRGLLFLASIYCGGHYLLRVVRGWTRGRPLPLPVVFVGVALGLVVALAVVILG